MAFNQASLIAIMFKNYKRFKFCGIKNLDKKKKKTLLLQEKQNKLQQYTA